MIAASTPIQRPREAKLLALDRGGTITHHPRSSWLELLRPGDLVVANDAATLPASLSGLHLPGGQIIEVRLAGRDSLSPAEVTRFSAVVFGEGDFRMRTEDRPNPPRMFPGDLLMLGPLRALVTKLLHHPRFVSLQFHGKPREIWEGIARHGRPIQYSHVPSQLQVWDTWTPIAGPPVAFEPPSAGFALDWKLIARMTDRGIRFATLTHAAGISSTGDPVLDALLPFDEPYRISPSTAHAINQARARNGRVIAVGTTVVRALEHSAGPDGIVRCGEAIADQRIGASTRLRVVDAILSGTHEPGSSHHELLKAFADESLLARVDSQLTELDYRTHEFGDSVFIESAGTEVHKEIAAPIPSLCAMV